ncbi:MAG: (Fe-S)-binding protein [Acidobacteriota bacterium]
MLTLIEAFIFSILLILTIYFFFTPLVLRFKLVKLGQDTERFNNPFKRVANAVANFFLLICSVKKERIFAGLAHIFLLYGSLTFDTISVFHILEGFNKNIHPSNIHVIIADFMSVMVLGATLFFIIKRYVVRNSSYTYGTKESAIIYALLITVTLTFLLYEGASISYHRTFDNSSAFIGKIVAGWIPSAWIAVKISWWLHILNVFAFILYVPRSKYMHMFMGPLNITFKSEKPNSYLKTVDLESAETFGVTSHEDLSWKDLFDGFACIDCGRCEDYCPAARTGKELSPKTIITKMRDDLLAEGEKKIKDPEYSLKPLMDRVFSDEEIWSCTTCGACMEVCPVLNEHIPKIIGLRQSRVLMEAKFPPEFNHFFRNLETNSNPWGFGSATRGEWTEGLKVPMAAENQEAEVLYWVGCAGSFDERNKKVTEAMVSILNKSGVSYVVLGGEENCCGDPARRAGNEYLFQMMATQNIEILMKYKFKKIVTTCPHCLSTFRNEYNDVAALTGTEFKIPEVVHHSEFINELIKEGRISIKGSGTEQVTYHDPCYLGRHNNTYDQPREVISKAGFSIIEMKDNKNHSFCCGGGGSLMWAEEDQGERINHIRTEEALETGTGTLCTSCPYCTTMLTDGIKDKEKEDTMQVKDIAEIIAENLKE